MFYVDNPTGVPVMPEPSPVSSLTDLFFTEGGNGVPPTYPGPDWFNIIQSELLNIVREAGLDPDKMTQTQILDALKKLFLQRQNPFGDIKADGAEAVATALANLGLGDAAKRSVGSGANQIPDMSYFIAGRASSGYQKLPSGLIFQWGSGLAGVGTTANTGNTINFPIAFPGQCFQVITSYDNGGGVIVSGAAGSFSLSSFLLRCEASGGSYNFRWFAMGY